MTVDQYYVNMGDKSAKFINRNNFAMQNTIKYVSKDHKYEQSNNEM